MITQTPLYRLPRTAQETTQAMCNLVVRRWAIRDDHGAVVSHIGRVCYASAWDAQGAAEQLRQVPGATGFALRCCGDHWHLGESAPEPPVVLDSAAVA
jgi:hypothetical protein